MSLKIGDYKYLGVCTNNTIPGTYDQNDRVYYIYNAVQGLNTFSYIGITLTATENSVYSIVWDGYKWDYEKLPTTSKAYVDSVSAGNTTSLVDPANYLYVAKNGLDTNAGTGENPFLTISAAITAATSGTTICIFPGTYTENITFKAGVSLTSPIKFGVTISGNHTVNYTGTVVLDNITLTSSTGVTLTMSGTTAENFQLIGSSIVSTTGNAIYYTNTNASSKLYFEDGTCTTVGGSAFGCFQSTSTAAGSVIANRVTFSMTNKQYVTLNLAGAVSFTHTSDVVNGEILVANTASYVGQLVALTATGVPCISTSSTGASILFACTLSTSVTPIQGAGLFYYSALTYASTGVGAATTLNAGAGATPLPLSSLQLRQAVVRPTAYDGMLEYDGTHLYFTIGTTRHTLI